MKQRTSKLNNEGTASSKYENTSNFIKEESSEDNYQVISEEEEEDVEVDEYLVG